MGMGTTHVLFTMENKQIQWRIYIVKFWMRAPPPPPRGPNSFNFMQFLGKFGKIVCWRPPPPESWRPLLGEILDPPLKYQSQSQSYS